MGVYNIMDRLRALSEQDQNLKAKQAEKQTASARQTEPSPRPTPAPAVRTSDANDLSSILAGISDTDLEELVE